MARIQHALIMAAGRGQRMMPLTSKIPKAMAPFDGSTLIALSINKLFKHISNVHITVGYKGSMLAKHVVENNVSSIINTEGKGNSWWIFNSLLKNLDEPIFVLTCDNVTDLDFLALENDYFLLNEPVCCVVPVQPIIGLEGDYIHGSGNFVAKLDRQNQSEIYCSGIQILNPYRLNQLFPEGFDDFLPLWEALMKNKLLKYSNVQPINWFSIDTVGQLNFHNPKI